VLKLGQLITGDGYGKSNICAFAIVQSVAVVKDGVDAAIYSTRQHHNATHSR